MLGRASVATKTNPPPPTRIERPQRWLKQLKEGYYHSPHFNIASLTPTSLLPRETLRWIRNASDERAAQEGMRFAEHCGQFAVDWVEHYCYLYEGSKAGLPIDIDDWQYEYFMQVFGWMQKSKNEQFLGRIIRRFTSGHIWVPKKNKKSPTLAATGCYMLIAENEQGQHIYSAAADGEQARIAHMHAVNMIEQSPELATACSINRGTHQIDYYWTNSTYKVVSGKNVKGQQGLNGSVLIDEVHVVSKALYDTLQYAGISRAEPLFLTFSTAGDDLTSLGYDLYDKSVKIAKGTEYNPHCYVSLFGDFSTFRHPETKRQLSPDDWYDESLALKLAKRANPALGSTINESELTSSYRAAVRTPTELSRFLKYRVNQWTSGDNGWIVDEYSRCQKEFTYEDMYKAQAPCTLAFDLSQTGDTTACTATWGIKTGIAGTSEEYVIPHQITWSWIPERTARKRLQEHDIDFSSWANVYDNVTVCKNCSTIPYSVVGQFIEWFLDYFDCRAIGYDVWNSSGMVNDLICNFGVSESLLIKVPQKMAVMGPFTQALEKRALDGTLVVGKSDYMLWQAGNVQLTYDPAGNYKPAKKDRSSPKSVDGIVTSIMSNGVFHLPELGLTTEPICSISMLEPAQQRSRV